VPGIVLNYKPVVVVSTENLSKADWLEYRHKGIGGSDAAAVLGLSPFCTTRDLYYDKAGIKPAIEEEQNWVAKEVGHLLEDLVARIFSRKTGLRVYAVKKMFSHPDHPFMLADVDFFVEMPDGSTGILECKTTNYNAQEKWADGTVPVNYELQGRHYMAVMNINTVFFACLWGNNENEFAYRHMERDLDYEADLIGQEKYFWEEFVMAGVEPPYTESGDLILDSIRRHYGNADSSASAIKLDTTYAKSIEQYLSLREEKLALENKAKKLEDEMKRVYAPIVDKMGVSCGAVCTSGKTEYAVSYKPYYRTGISKDDLGKLEVAHPSIYEDYVSTTESRRFSVKKKECA
jgi:putative phage-type endonuclease